LSDAPSVDNAPSIVRDELELFESTQFRARKKNGGPKPAVELAVKPVRY
jgi:hypothetical protein